MLSSFFLSINSWEKFFSFILSCWCNQFFFLFWYKYGREEISSLKDFSVSLYIKWRKERGLSRSVRRVERDKKVLHPAPVAPHKSFTFKLVPIENVLCEFLIKFSTSSSLRVYVKIDFISIGVIEWHCVIRVELRRRFWIDLAELLRCSSNSIQSHFVVVS